MHWWETKTAAFSFLLLGLGGGGVIAFLSPQFGIPLCIIIILIGGYLLFRAYRYRDKALALSKPEVSNQIESPINSIIQELESKFILQDRRYSMLEIFDALRDSFALGLTYPQVHGVLRRKLYSDAAWGIHSSDILAIFTQLGLIHSPSIDPTYSVLLDYQRTIPDYVYQLTDIGKSLAHKLMSQRPIPDKGGSQN